ncbi:oxidoreductase [Promicromonospora sp. NPDC050262]|uniref:SDR family NAD(P)-dependent oxidoreductase n=1 Tax=Promicromonospora sp. NPDC050262 TaxID=3155036 RepID=UPI0033D46929
MDLGLNDKVAIVTGASRGIGLAIVDGLAREGAKIVAVARTLTPELEALAATGVTPFLVDVTAEDGPTAMVEAAVERFGQLDILVNNVGGVRPRTSGFLEVSDADWNWALSLNLMSAVRGTRAALPELMKRPASSIVTISSVNAVLPDPSVIDYSAAKAALSNFSKSISKEFGPRGVRANTISPGPVETGLWLGHDGVAETVAQATGKDPAAVAADAVAGIPTGRFTTPREVADLAVLLASPRTANVTGSNYAVDGGLPETL